MKMKKIKLKIKLKKINFYKKIKRERPKFSFTKILALEIFDGKISKT